MTAKKSGNIKKCLTKRELIAAINKGKPHAFCMRSFFTQFPEKRIVIPFFKARLKDIFKNRKLEKRRKQEKNEEKQSNQFVN